MAYRPVLRRANAVPVAAGVALAASIFYPIRPVYAESPDSSETGAQVLKKPIYDDLTPELPSAPPSKSRSSPSKSASSSPTSADSTTAPPSPTDRLAVYVRRARLALYSVSSRAEASLNSALTEALHLENSFTSTVASLAPPKSANEALVPGLIYVLVAALAGSIVTRRRGFALRLAVPATFAVGMGYAVIPATMANVGELVWSYEKRFPALADAHTRAAARARYLWETSKSHSAMTVDMASDKVGEARKGVEDWVRKGR